MKKLTRRHLLTTFAAMPVIAMASPVIVKAKYLDGIASGMGKECPRLVIIHLRGALDGLAAVPAYGDPDYRTVRGALALSPPGCRGEHLGRRHDDIVDLDGFFGLHPALGPLHRFFTKGEMLVLPAVAAAYRTQSHEIGQYVASHGADPSAIEPSTIESSAIDSFVTSSATWPARAASLLRSAHMTASACDRARIAPSQLGMIADLCQGNPSLVRSLAISDFPTDLDAVYRMQAKNFRKIAEETGLRLANDDRTRLFSLESHGWDTHASQGAGDGRLAIALAGLADGISVLAKASGTAWRQSVVLVMTEFGRSVGMNTMGGTDHGTASIALLLGGVVAGGRVLGQWPGLSADRLYRGRDLAPCMNLNAVIKAVLTQYLHLPTNAVDQVILPRQTATRPLAGLFRS